MNFELNNMSRQTKLINLYLIKVIVVFPLRYLSFGGFMVGFFMAIKNGKLNSFYKFNVQKRILYDLIEKQNIERILCFFQKIMKI